MDSRNQNARRARVIARCGLLCALALTLAFLESTLPPVVVSVPGIKLGLSNIITMYALYTVGPITALTVALLKSGYVLLTRSPTSALLSAVGGLCSVGLLILLRSAKKLEFSVVFISICAAVAHNIGQLFGAYLLMGSPLVFWYLPALILFGVAMGAVTGLTLKILEPYIKKL